MFLCFMARRMFNLARLFAITKGLKRTEISSKITEQKALYFVSLYICCITYCSRQCRNIQRGFWEVNLIKHIKLISYSFTSFLMAGHVTTLAFMTKWAFISAWDLVIGARLQGRSRYSVQLCCRADRFDAAIFHIIRVDKISPSWSANFCWDSVRIGSMIGGWIR